MINRKTLGILAVVLVGLVLVSYTAKNKRYGTTKGGGYAEILAEPIDTGSVESVKAWLGSAPDSSVELARAGDGWEVASSWGWTAKTDLVQRLLDDLEGLKGEVRASKADILSDFQIDDESGLHVTGLAPGGTELFHLVVGKGASRGGSFVRQHGSNDVYLTQATLRSSFGVWGDEPKPPQAKRWIELRVHQAERNDVDRILLKYEGKEVLLEKEFELADAAPPSEGAEAESEETAEEAAPSEAPLDRTQWTWKADAAGEFDKGKVDGILSTLCSLYAADVADPANLDSYGLGDDARVAEVTFQDGTVETILFGSVTEDDEARVYFQVGSEGRPAEIYKSTADRIFPDRSELKPKET